MRAHVTMWIDAAPERIFDAFLTPKVLTRFWLSDASASLQIGVPVRWAFMVAGAEVETTARTLDRPKTMAWDWSDGSQVTIDLEAFGGGTAVSVVNSGFKGSPQQQIDAALNSTEGFSIVLCDLKTLLETGESSGLTRAKARLIEARR